MDYRYNFIEKLYSSLYIRLSFFKVTGGDRQAGRKKVEFDHSKLSVSMRENVAIHHTNVTLPLDRAIWHPSPQTATFFKGNPMGGRPRTHRPGMRLIQKVLFFPELDSQNYHVIIM